MCMYVQTFDTPIVYQETVEAFILALYTSIINNGI